jgi:hypothetical protein
MGVVSEITSQDRKKHNLKRVKFWYDWGMIRDKEQESYQSIVPGIVPKLLLRV